MNKYFTSCVTPPTPVDFVFASSLVMAARSIAMGSNRTNWDRTEYLAAVCHSVIRKGFPVLTFAADSNYYEIHRALGAQPLRHFRSHLRIIALEDATFSHGGRIVKGKMSVENGETIVIAPKWGKNIQNIVNIEWDTEQ